MGLVLYIQATLTLVLIVTVALVLARLRAVKTIEAKVSTHGVELATAQASIDVMRATLAESGHLAVSQRVMMRWEVLCATSRALGNSAEHCYGPECFQREREEAGEMDACSCGCTPCRRAVVLLHKAEHDIRWGRG